LTASVIVPGVRLDEGVAVSQAALDVRVHTVAAPPALTLTVFGPGEDVGVLANATLVGAELKVTAGCAARILMLL
jgi:hypothetical protein